MKMKHMGQLWLASEVRALESRVRGKASLSPYLVLDADALIKYTFMVKHFVHSRKFIVLIPSAGTTPHFLKIFKILHPSCSCFSFGRPKTRAVRGPGRHSVAGVAVPPRQPVFPGPETAGESRDPLHQVPEEEGQRDVHVHPDYRVLLFSGRAAERRR